MYVKKKNNVKERWHDRISVTRVPRSKAKMPVVVVSALMD